MIKIKVYRREQLILVWRKQVALTVDFLFVHHAANLRMRFFCHKPHNFFTLTTKK